MQKPIESVSLEQVRRYCYRRQGFGLDRARTVLEIADRVAGLYGTAPTCYLSMAARMNGFGLQDLDTELYVNKSLIRMRAMRGSMFVVPTSIVPAVHQATGASARKAFKRLIEKCGVSAARYSKTAEKIMDALATGPLTVAEIRKTVSPLSKEEERALNFIIGLMCGEGLLVRATVKGGWRSDQYRYARFAEWLTGVDLDSVDARQGRAIVARRYFESFGPASLADFLWWSGFSKNDGEEILSDIADLRSIEIQGRQGEYYLFESELKNFKADSAKPIGGVSILPPWDAYLMGYRARDRFISSESYDLVYDRSGNSTYVILADGVVSGIWDLYEDKKGVTFSFALFNKAAKRVKEELARTIAAEFESLRMFEIRIQECDQPPPLTEGSNRFQAPLKDATCKDFSSKSKPNKSAVS